MKSTTWVIVDAVRRKCGGGCLGLPPARRGTALENIGRSGVPCSCVSPRATTRLSLHYTIEGNESSKKNTILRATSASTHERGLSGLTPQNALPTEPRYRPVVSF